MITAPAAQLHMRSLGVPTVSMATHMWIHWLQVAAAQQHDAREARARLENLSPATRPNEEMTAELHASMVAISASAHAIDAVYGEIKPLVPIPPDLEASWEPKNGKEGASRHIIISDTLKKGCVLGLRFNRWPRELKWLYNLRNSAVHHQLRMRPTTPHPGFPTSNVAHEMDDYCLENATKALRLAVDVAVTTIESPRVPELIERAKQMSHVPEELRALRPTS